MNNFLIITNTDKDVELTLTDKIIEYLRSKNANTTLCLDIYDEKYDEPKEEGWFSDKIECAIVLGGDGTILRASRVLLNKDIPILGVNLGTVGFLAEVEPVDIEYTLDMILKNEYKTEDRMLIRGSIIHNGEKVYTSFSLNEVVISRSGISRIIELNLYVNGELIDVYQADGVIVATPTGSTGYNLSAGGPVVSPNTKVILVTPILPHSLTAKSVVLAANDRVIVEVGKVRKTQKEEAVATFDGQMGIELEPGDIIEISKAIETTRLIKINNTSFYRVLRNKIYYKKDY